MRRVGSITLGFSLILFGILGICAVVNPAFSIQSVLQFWPAVLIGFGIEAVSYTHLDVYKRQTDFAGTLLL